MRLLHHGTNAGYQNLPLLRYRIREGNLTGDAFATLDREIVVLGRLRSKNILNGQELAALEGRLRELDAAKTILLGKRFLIARDYPQALKNFRHAHALWPKVKLNFVVHTFRITAPLLRWFVLAREPHNLR